MELNEGPKVFVKRLQDQKKLPDDFYLCNPNNASVEQSKKLKAEGKIIIARLDGARPYKFTLMEILGFLKTINKFPEHIPLHDRKSIELNKQFTKFLNRYLDRNSLWLHKNADGIIFQSNFSKQMHEFFLQYDDKKTSEVILNGIDLSRFYPSGKSTSENFPNVIISASIFRPHKRLSDSIDLINRLSKNYPKIKLHILGNLNKFVKEEIRNKDLKYCKFYGQKKVNELPDIYRKVDFQMSLSLFDPCPNVVVEGLASGLPVVTCQESGSFQLIDYEDSWSVKEEIDLQYLEFHRPNRIPKINFGKYEEKILKLLENIQINKEKARYIAEKNLDIKKISDKYLSFFEKIKKFNS